MITITPLELAAAAISGMDAMQKAHELAALIAMVDELKPAIVVEIGVGKGGTTWAWSKLSSVKKIICIDLPGGSWGGESQEETSKTLKYITENSGVDIHLISGNSQNSECLESLKNSLDRESIDFLMIDGDHSYAGVKTDFLTYEPLVREGGLVGLHDIVKHPPESGCEVEKFWTELKETWPKEKYVEFISSQDTAPWAGITVVKK